MDTSLKRRLAFDLTKVRKELIEVVSAIPTADLDYVPADGMKSYRELIGEIGAMEHESLVLVSTGIAPDWAECEAQLRGQTTEELLADLAAIRMTLLTWIEEAPESGLQSLIPLPEEWHPYYDGPDIVAEELIRWVTRHEYYHLGQIITYRWIQGINPYR